MKIRPVNLNGPVVGFTGVTDVLPVFKLADPDIAYPKNEKHIEIYYLSDLNLQEAV